MSFFNSLPLFIGNLRSYEWIILLCVFLLLFGGAATIRKFMRNAGKGVNAFKQGLEDAKAEMRKPIEQTAAPKPDEPAANTPAADNTPAPGAPANPRAAAKDVDR